MYAKTIVHIRPKFLEDILLKQNISMRKLSEMMGMNRCRVQKWIDRKCGVSPYGRQLLTKALKEELKIDFQWGDMFRVIKDEER